MPVINGQRQIDPAILANIERIKVEGARPFGQMTEGEWNSFTGLASETLKMIAAQAKRSAIIRNVTQRGFSRKAY